MSSRFTIGMHIIKTHQVKIVPMLKVESYLLPSMCCGGLAVDAYGVGSVGFTS